MYKLKLLYIVCLFLISPSLIDNGAGDIRFRQMTINDGLSLSSIYCIFQDSKGYMWFGSEDGLNRYDGRDITIFRPDPNDTNSLSFRWTEHIVEDAEGIIWFGSRGGLSRFDPATESFRQYFTARNTPYRLINDTVTCLYADNNYIWVGTQHGLSRVKLKSGELRSDVQAFSGLPGLYSRIYALHADNEENLWIGTGEGLFYYNGTDENITHIDISGETGVKSIFSIASGNNTLWIGTDQGLVSYNINDGDLNHIPILVRGNRARSDQSVQKIYVDTNDKIWLVTSDGLLKYDQLKKEITRVIESTDYSHSLSTNAIKPLYVDSHNTLWFGTFGSGLFRIDQGTGQVDNYIHSPANPSSLAEDAINCIYEDRSGVIWFGTFGAGISIYDPQSHKFKLYKHSAVDPNSLSSNFIWSIWEDTDGSVWVGTNDRGINHYDPKTNTYTFYNHVDGDPQSLSHSSVREIYQDSKGTIWIGTDGGGLNRFNTSSGTFTHFMYDPLVPGSISSNSVRAIHEDRKGNLWIGTKSGLNRYIPESNSFKRYLHDPADSSSISSNFIYSSIYEDEEGFLWLGTYGGGLNKMDVRTETFTHYLKQIGNVKTIADNAVFTIYKAPDGIFWIGTNNGLNRLDPETGRFTRFGPEEGLPNEVIYGILPDGENNIWLSTNLGISQFNLEDYSTVNYDVNDGLQSNEFNGGAFHKGHSGLLYFGGVYGLNIIDPGSIKPVSNNVNVIITKLEILGSEVGILPPSLQDGKNSLEVRICEEDGTYCLPKDITFTNEIVLDHKYRFFSLEFSALNSPQPDKLGFSYYMENLDMTWKDAGRRNYVSYANMPPGKYTFYVRAHTPDGVWSESTAQLKITVTPPFWKRWWFIILEISMAITLVVFIYYYLLKIRTNKILKTQYEEINIAHQKLASSEKDLKEINATKDKFFSIISHDLKNPFGSLISVSEMIIQNFSSTTKEDHLSGFKRIHDSIKHSYQLLENLLTWSRAQTGRLDFSPTDFNLSRLIQENVNLHRVQAEEKGIEISCQEQDEISAFGDREMINTVVRNLVNNAVKFCEKGDKISIQVNKTNGKLEVLVKDSGTGISPENLDKLFKIDQKFKTNGTASENGTGLGLILAREFVEKNGGEMIVESIYGQGSTFGFTLPSH